MLKNFTAKLIMYDKSLVVDIRPSGHRMYLSSKNLVQGGVGMKFNFSGGCGCLIWTQHLGLLAS